MWTPSQLSSQLIKAQPRPKSQRLRSRAEVSTRSDRAALLSRSLNRNSHGAAGEDRRWLPVLVRHQRRLGHASQRASMQALAWGMLGLHWCAPCMCTCRSCGSEALLLLRNSRHNDKTWGLPGGNVDPGEDLQSTAARECVEEMGTAPTHVVKGQVLTKRGKHEQKHYTGALEPPCMNTMMCVCVYTCVSTWVDEWISDRHVDHSPLLQQCSWPRSRPRSG